MIRVTRLNNMSFVVNSDLIKFVEEAPDTLITLVNGEKIIVRERAQDIVERVVRFRREVGSGPATTSCLANHGAGETESEHYINEKTSEGQSRG